MFKQIKISTSIYIILTIFMVLQIFSSTMSLVIADKNDSDFSEAVLLNDQIDQLALARRNLIQARVDSARAVISIAAGDSSAVAEQIKTAEQALKSAIIAMNTFGTMPSPKEELNPLIQDIVAKSNDTFALMSKQLEILRKGGGVAEWRAIKVQATQDLVRDQANKFVDEVAVILQDFNENSAANHNASEIYFVLEITIALVLFFLTIWWTRNIVRKPLEKLIDHFNHIADGDLTQKAIVEGKNEISKLFEYFNKMQSYLINTVLVVRDSSSLMANSVEAMSIRNDELAARTEEQASALQETAASMEELTATVKLNTENARSAATFAQDSSSTASRGGSITQTVVDTMKDISESSQKIGAITNVIDGIAFQTNILALNAAVEAARAGEQGRGFAVVAGEVRSLAQRSAQAAQEIKSLIDESIERVNLGSELVESAGSTMIEIVSSVSKVTDFMGEIASASDEQSRGIDLVSQAVHQMDQTTQQNSTLVNELAYSAKELENQAYQLTEAVSAFRIGNH